MKLYRKMKLLLTSMLIFFKNKQNTFTLVLKGSSGFSLMEILVVVGISSVILVGTFKILSVSTQSSQIVSSSFSEQDLRVVLGQILGEPEQCKINLDPFTTGRLDGTDKLLGLGTVSMLTKDGIELVQINSLFKNDLHIIKMELMGDNTQDPKIGIVERTFVVYYKKNIMGEQSSLGGEVCDASDVRGCYFSKCTLGYKLETPTNVVKTCDVMDCTGGEENIACYTVDDLEDSHPDTGGYTGEGRTLVGCGGTSEIERSGVTAFGFGAGKSNTPDGLSNTYIGYKAGYQNTKGGHNTFIGYEAGKHSDSILKLQANTYIGYRAGFNATEGGSNVFVGSESGYESKENSSNNIFLGYRAGYGHQKGNENVYIGHEVGYSYDNIANTPTTSGPPFNTGDETEENVFIGYQAGYGLTTGDRNTFVGHQAGYENQSGDVNIYIGKSVGPVIGVSPKPADISPTSDRQINIGNLILGRTPNPYVTPNPLLGSPDIPAFATPGVVINGDLKVRGSIEYCINSTSAACSGGMLILSSKVYKKNIKSFKDYERALDDIINTPLFTYEYKKDRPEKTRMGIISEELPEHLQLKGKKGDKKKGKEVDSRLRGNDDGGEKGAPSMPDWPTIYGTFWASIKALSIKFKDFKDEILSELKTLKEQFTATLKDVEGNKKVFGSLNEEIKNTVDVSKTNQKENEERDKELTKLKTLLKETTEELKEHKQTLTDIKIMIQKNKNQYPPTDKKPLEAKLK